MADDYTFQDKLTFKETIMFHLRVMSKEGAQDGWLKQYEDLVDQLGIYCWPYFDDDQRKKWYAWDRHGMHLTEYDKPDQYGIKQRERINGKMRMCILKLDEMGILLRKIRSFGVDTEMPELIK